MAEEKKGFLLYCDFIHTLEKMPDDKAGLLFKHILRYVNDLDPSTDDLLVDLAFEPIKQQLKRDLKKFEKAKEEKSIAGRMGNLKRWNTDLYDKVLAGLMTLEEAENIAKNRRTSHTDTLPSLPIANIAVNDNVSVTDTVTVNVTDTVIDNDISTNVDSYLDGKPKKDFPIQKVSKSKLKWTEQELQQEIVKFIETYPSEMLRSFYEYWTEKDKLGNMRINQPKYKTFEVGKRLATWSRNNFNNNSNNKTNEQQQFDKRKDEAGTALIRAIMAQNKNATTLERVQEPITEEVRKDANEWKGIDYGKLASDSNNAE